MDKKVLGKGLSALIPDKPVKAGGKVLDIKIAQINVSTFQPRQEFNAEKLAELTASIKEKGVIQPVIVRPQKTGGYELIAGERRLRAAKTLGFTQLPAIIKDIGDDEALQLSLIENIQREELNPLEEAQAYEQLITDFGYSQEKIAQALGKSASAVSNTLRLLKLPQVIQTALRKNMISMGHARSILGVRDLAVQSQLFKRALTRNLSVRELESLVTKMSTGFKRKAQPRRDPHLVALEEQLQRLIGTKVKIVAGRKRGKIVLEYYSLNDLDRIVNLLRKVNKS
ncbi:ParB/RepB/Spo0J family partition protein [Candidatus Omnitrophota bacterium]